jgi:predicted peroxiredoxin
MKKSLAALTSCALALSLMTATAAQASELFVSIHSGNAMAQGAGLVLAGQALQQKAQVRVLLCDAAADIAVAGQAMPTLKPRNVTPQQLLQGVIQAGAQVEVCALYLPNTGRQASELIPGVTAAKPADVAAHLLKPGVKTLAF